MSISKISKEIERWIIFQMSFIAEPNFNNEQDLTNAVIGEIRGILSNNNGVVDFWIRREKPFDIFIIIKKSNKQTRVKFIEVKHYNPKNNRINFGNKKGEGIQVDLLLLGNKKLEWLNQHISWVFGDQSKSYGKKRFSFLDNMTIRDFAANGVKKGKTNNFTVGKITTNLIFWVDLSKKVQSYILDL